MVNLRLPAILLLVLAFLSVLFTPLHADGWSENDRSNLRLIQESREALNLPLPEGKTRLDLSDETDELEMAGLVLLRLYQVVLSSQDGPRCMFYPSCSEYAKQAISERGVVAGTLLAVDRYLRCNGVDRDLYPYDARLRKLLDPVPKKKSKQASK
jgi:putative membrane protein insertion efficiency factor